MEMLGHKVDYAIVAECSELTGHEIRKQLNRKRRVEVKERDLDRRNKRKQKRSQAY